MGSSFKEKLSSVIKICTREELGGIKIRSRVIYYDPTFEFFAHILEFFLAQEDLWVCFKRHLPCMQELLANV